MSSETPPPAAGSKKANYRIRFRHGVYPNTGVEASRADIKKYDYFFETGQRWVETGGNVDFVDESGQIAEEIQPHGAVESVWDGTKPSVRRSARLRRPEVRSREPSAGLGTPELLATPNFTLDSADPYTYTGNNSPIERTFVCRQSRSRSSVSPSQIPIIRTSPSVATTRSGSSIDFTFSRSPSPSIPKSAFSQPPEPTRKIPWPLEDPIEARLFRFWVDSASEWWDITSSQSIWKEVTPKLALTNDILLNAIFMTAAQHIIRVDPGFPVNPLVYHQRVLQGLIPHLAERGYIADEGTFAAAMLLRSFEEHRAGTYGQTHLSTHQLFTDPTAPLFTSASRLTHTCVMTHVHFEILHALLNHPSLTLPYDVFMACRLRKPSDDVEWKDRIVWICARILKVCDMKELSMEEWLTLKEQVDEWEKDRPNSFDAFFWKETGNEDIFFPEICFAMACHTNANQHLRICRLALAMSRPITEYGSEEMRNLTDWRRRELLQGLKEIIAIARCNTYAVCAPFIAAHAIHKFAVTIHDGLTQSKIIECLEETTGMGYPTEETIEMLKMQWNWSNH